MKIYPEHRAGLFQLSLVSFSLHSPNLSTLSQLFLIRSRFLGFGIRVAVWPLNPQQSPRAQVERNQSWRCSWLWSAGWKEAVWPALGDIQHWTKWPLGGRGKFSPKDQLSDFNMELVAVLPSKRTASVNIWFFFFFFCLNWARSSFTGKCSQSVLIPLKTCLSLETEHG